MMTDVERAGLTEEELAERFRVMPLDEFLRECAVLMRRGREEIDRLRAENARLKERRAWGGEGDEAFLASLRSLVADRRNRGVALPAAELVRLLALLDAAHDELHEAHAILADKGQDAGVYDRSRDGWRAEGAEEERERCAVIARVRAALWPSGPVREALLGLADCFITFPPLPPAPPPSSSRRRADAAVAVVRGLVGWWDEGNDTGHPDDLPAWEAARRLLAAEGEVGHG